MSVNCTPICPFRAFYCTKKALIIRRRGNELVAFCSWTGDLCIGYRCQFALCNKHALLPDGTCSLLTRAVRRKERPSIEEEAAKLEREYVTIKDKLRKLDFDLEKLE